MTLQSLIALKKLSLLGLSASAFFLTACQKESTLSIVDMRVADALQAGVPYSVSFTPRTQGGAVEIIEACFLWSGEGPFCFPTRQARSGNRTVFQVTLYTNNPNSYELEGYIVYQSSDGRRYETNRLSREITVAPR